VTTLPFDALRPLFIAAATLGGAAAMIAWRLRETSRPMTMRRIVAPPLGMSTGLAMFLVPAFRLPWSWALGALAAGALVLAIPLARTARLVRRGDAITLERSAAFLWILAGLVMVRLALRTWVEQYVSLQQTGALFFLLALGMILRWRVTMALEYRRLAASPAPDAAARAGPASRLAVGPVTERAPP